MIVQVKIPCEGANDSQRFLLEYFDAVKESPSRIYHSALPFCPSSSWIHKCYRAEFSQEVKVVKGVPARWGKCSRTVSLNGSITCLSYRNNTIAVGLGDGEIIILEAATGSQTVTFSGHTDKVGCLVFSSDGRLLVSGSGDKAVKLWDMQTGGVVKTFSGHTDGIWSVAISADFATIASASGSISGSIYLWSIHTRKCYCVIEQEDAVLHVRFSPTDPQLLLSVCDGKVWQWNTNGNQVGPTYDGCSIDFSPDGTQFVICNEESVTVQDSSSGETVTKLHMGNGADLEDCCFSPDGKLVAVSDQGVVNIWDITSSDPHLIETFCGGFDGVSTLLFSSPSSLILVADYKFIQFWHIASPSMDLAETDPQSTSLISTGGVLVTLQAKDEIIITCEMKTLKVWDVLTGLCKASFQIPPKEVSYALSLEHAKLVNGRLIMTWYEDGTIYFWDVEKGEPLWAVDAHDRAHSIMISQDGSMVFCLYKGSLHTLSAETGEAISKVKVKAGIGYYLTVDGFGVWVYYSDSEYQGWKFGISGLSPVQLLDVPPHQGYLNNTLRWDPYLLGIKNEAIGKVVFWVPEKYGDVFDVQWNESCLVICFYSKEVLILDCRHIL